MNNFSRKLQNSSEVHEIWSTIEKTFEINAYLDKTGFLRDEAKKIGIQDNLGLGIIICRGIFPRRSIHARIFIVLAFTLWTSYFSLKYILSKLILK